MIDGHWWPVIDIAQREKKRKPEGYRCRRLFEEQTNCPTFSYDSCHLFRTDFLCTFTGQHQNNSVLVIIKEDFVINGVVSLLRLLLCWWSDMLNATSCDFAWTLIGCQCFFHPSSPSNENHPILVTSSLVWVVMWSQRSAWVKRIF